MDIQFASILWNPSPRIFDALPIRWYGLLFAVGFIGAYQVLSRIFQRDGVSQKILDSLVFYMIIATVIGARLGHCLFYEPDVYLADPISILKVWEGGLASHGAAIGILVATILFVMKHREFPFLWLADRLCVAIPFTAMCVRIGNFINSEILGAPCDLPWAVIFSAKDMLPRHPAQLYEGATYLVLFLLMLFLYFKKSDKLSSGFLTGIFLTVMFLMRFLIEYVKDVQVEFENSLILHMGQFLSLPFILLGIGLIVYSVRQSRAIK
ncbi:MAG: prolipoprotein diacylglyceryl transferase [Candidatus Kapabacteria bacterium]|nr:prolipoprotein diacylglyceryl transferase [Candidatus Kapabacteria bacterium]